VDAAVTAGVDLHNASNRLLHHTIEELRDKVGCDGEVRFNLHQGCYCSPDAPEISLLGGGLSELIILKSTPLVAFLLTFLHIFQWWRCTWRHPGGLAFPFRTRVWRLLVHVQQACCSLMEHRLSFRKDEQLRREVENQRCRYAGKMLMRVNTVIHSKAKRRSGDTGSSRGSNRSISSQIPPSTCPKQSGTTV
jgi:hypothetical protein